MARTKLHVMREPEWSTRQEDMDRPVGPARRSSPTSSILVYLDGDGCDNVNDSPTYCESN